MLISSSVPKSRVSRRYSSRFVRYHAVCSNAVKNASPIVIETKKKWLIVTNANCHRTRSTVIVGHLRENDCTVSSWSLTVRVLRESPGGHRPNMGIAGTGDLLVAFHQKEGMPRARPAAMVDP